MATQNVGALIERARVAAGLSQRALADETGISQPTLSRIISGHRATKMREALLHFLELDDYLDDQGIPPRSEPRTTL
ncbi:MAG TPA: helix-turn-helix transcriptional regulator [Jiangellaceae bacterium]|nr:helix-turn-helix transcriptional regulator [Jiangellaceae bacterium]